MGTLQPAILSVNPDQEQTRKKTLDHLRRIAKQRSMRIVTLRQARRSGERLYKVQVAVDVPVFDLKRPTLADLLLYFDSEARP